MNKNHILDYIEDSLASMDDLPHEDCDKIHSLAFSLLDHVRCGGTISDFIMN